jgi:hypothetical protein
MMSEKIRVLFLAANPIDTSYRLRLDEEMREITREIRSSPYSYLFEIHSEWAVRPKDLQEALVLYRPHIIHLSGHATRAKGIMLEDESGKLCPISVQAFVDLFRVLRGSTRLVFLNLCYTERHIRQLSELIDYTIGIKTKIGDKGAIIFSASFYKGLALGLPVKTAFELAINHLMLRNMRFSTSPLLMVRDGINESESLLTESEQGATFPFLTDYMRGDSDNRVLPLSLEPVRGLELKSVRKDKKKNHKKDKKKRRVKKKKIEESGMTQIAELLEEIRFDIKQVLAKIP